jgi:prepilin-type processing-associated H-X9-DG protein
VARLVASVGLGEEEGVAPHFSPMHDVTDGGVLLALPALLAVGLLRDTEHHFSLPRGYYGLFSIFMLLGFMALCRMKAMEGLRYKAPGEWGKLLGLDRVPEVRTLREKVRILAESGQPMPWSAALCRDWLAESPLRAQVCYVDGHVRVYHGEQTDLPRHYVSRQRLCLRASVDYWVNAMDGQPFFVVHQDVDPGLVKVVETEILPRLAQDIPGQPSAEQLEANPLLHRFTIVFDREGYSPHLMLKMRQLRIASVTYRKKPGDDWPQEEFATYQVKLVGGEVTTMLLAERGVHLGGVVWVREFRRLTDSGHQTSIVTTDYLNEMAQLAATMFARWCQENFFAYMRQHYGLDKLVTYDTEEVPDTTQVVNPAYRRLDGDIRKKTSRLRRVAAHFGNLGLEGEIDPDRVETYEWKKGELQEEVEHLRGEIVALKAERKQVKRHITFGELPEEARFERLAINSKHMIDTIKMVAYRAETAMAHTLKEKMSRQDDARTLLRSIYTTEADLLPDENKKTLTVRLHNMASRIHDAAVMHLCDELNATETVYPGTDLRLVYELVSSGIPRDQEF